MTARERGQHTPGSAHSSSSDLPASKTLYGALKEVVVRNPDALAVVCADAVSTYLKSSEVAYVLRRSGALHLVMLDRTRDREFTSILLEACSEIRTQTRWTVRSSSLPELRNIVLLRRDSSIPPPLPCFDFEEVENAGLEPTVAAAAREVESTVTSDHLAMIKYTSGSTGFPRV
jgi:fatty-acyl-CoA synthase